MANSTNVTPITAATGAGKTRTVTQKTTASEARNFSTQTSGAGGGPGDWAHSVESRLGELRTDMRNLLIGGAFVAIALVGAGWKTYDSAMEQMRAVAVSQQQLAGKIDTLDARLNGRFDLMNERLAENGKGKNHDEQSR